MEARGDEGIGGGRMQRGSYLLLMEVGVSEGWRAIQL